MGSGGKFARRLGLGRVCTIARPLDSGVHVGCWAMWEFVRFGVLGGVCGMFRGNAEISGFCCGVATVWRVLCCGN